MHVSVSEAVDAARKEAGATLGGVVVKLRIRELLRSRQQSRLVNITAFSSNRSGISELWIPLSACITDGVSIVALPNR